MTPLFISHDADYDWLVALEYGKTDDGQPSENWQEISEGFFYLLTEPEQGRCVGFAIQEFSEFDPDAEEVSAIWGEPRFDVPVLGLCNATAGEIVVASRPYLDGDSTINRHFFDQAVAATRKPKKALEQWRYCLQTGDVMAHYGLGYTLYDMGRYHEAYRHLRAYTEITPSNAWAWCWRGKAAQAIGETGEAADAYRRALELSEAGGHETQADELLEALEG